MAGMGIWFENFALPAVINECLMQSYDGLIHLFPNWPAHMDARFHHLRAAGAFLVSADKIKGKVVHVELQSEKGGMLRLLSPWGKNGHITRRGRTTNITDDILRLDTNPGEIIKFDP
jgi:hypothetical protein